MLALKVQRSGDNFLIKCNLISQQRQMNYLNKPKLRYESNN